ncbi:MAG: insulinase family protein [Xanthomonadales bacterium]|nr:insulinase family protein [Xanthomonadales bacterium]MBP6078842.1 insulinase family protein [Xanthomonadales bacterium]
MTLNRLAFGLAAVLAAAPVAADYKAPIDIPFTQFKLDNGLTVIVHEDHKAPIVAVNLWYHVGSKNEQPGRTGFAHLFEHLMFQGSENYKDEFFKPFEKVGATDQNGTTDFDRTNYFQNVPTTALDTALWMESDRMGHLLGAIDQKVLDEQRGVVQNEKRQGDNAPYGKTFYSVLEGVFPEGHPYRWEPIGSMADLNAASLDDVKEWFKTWYGPSNTVLVLAGDIDATTARKKVEQYFGDIPPGGPLTKRDVWAPKLTAPARDEMQDRVAQTRIIRAWVAPPAVARSSDELGLFARVLGQGKTSRLVQRLVLKDQLVSSVASFQYGLEIAGLFMIQADLKPGVDAARVEAIIDEELAKLVAEGPTVEEIKRARVAIEAGVIRGAERIGGFGGKADLLAECATYAHDPDCYKTSLANMAAATPASIRAVAQEWLTPNHYTLTISPFAEVKAGTAQVDRAKGVPETSSFPDLAFPNLQRGRLKNGIEVVLAERHEVPVVQMRMIFDAGYAADQGRKLGTASFAMNMLDEGTRTRDAVAIAARSEELGAQIGAYNSLDVSGATLSALKSELAGSLDLFADVVRNPKFDGKEMDRVKGQWMAQIAQEKTSPNALGMRVLPPLLYGEGHAYAIPLTGSGTEASIAALTPDDLAAFHRDFVRANNARIIVVGDTTMAEISSQLDRVFGDWLYDKMKRPDKNIAEVAVQTKPRVFLIDKPNAEQSVILAGQLIPSSKAADRQVMQTANSVFGGEFTARINMNLREDKHWAYGAYSYTSGALGQRPLMTSAGVQSDKTIESIQELQREFVEFAGARPPTAEEIQKIKTSDVRSLPGSFETAAAVLGAITDIVVYGRPDDYVQTLKASIEAQNDKDIAAAAQKYFQPDALTWVVVGDLSKIEAGIRALNLGEVKVLDADGKAIR